MLSLPSHSDTISIDLEKKIIYLSKISIENVPICVSNELTTRIASDGSSLDAFYVLVIRSKDRKNTDIDVKT